jgi:hypothetical protein
MINLLKACETVGLVGVDAMCTGLRAGVSFDDLKMAPERRFDNPVIFERIVWLA